MHRFPHPNGPSHSSAIWRWTVILLIAVLSALAAAPPALAATPGAVVAWGDNGYGQSTAPAGLNGVIAVAGGSYHSLALKSDGTVVAWGNDYAGQIDVPAGLAGVTAISASGRYNLALKSDGTVVAWGDNMTDQLNVPSGLVGVTAISAGVSHALALKGDGTVVGWGNDYSGQTNVPLGLAGVTAIAGGGGHSLAVKSDGTVVGWGSDAYGQIDVPAGLSGVIAVAAGEFHSLALKSDGTVVGWGSDGDGESNVPAGLTGVTAIAAGWASSMALKSDGTVVTWGTTFNNTLLVPQGLSKVTAIAANLFHDLAVVSTDTAAPTTMAALSGTKGASGWWAGPVTVTLTATDNTGGSGVASTSYSIDGAAAQAYSAPFTISNDGSHAVSFHSTDLAGNVEPAESTAFKIDQTPPTTTSTLSGTPGANGWYTSPVSIVLAGNDGSGSGVATTDYAIDNAACTPAALGGCLTYTGSPLNPVGDGSHTLTFFSQDVAGNVEAAHVQSLKVDTRPPVITCATPDGAWHATDVALACSASDGISGLANPSDAGFSLSTSVPAGVETNNAITGSRTVADLAGNAATAGPIGGNMVDKAPPAITIIAPNSSSYELNQAVMANYTCNDGGSGVATCAGPVANGSAIDTASVGSKAFVVSAKDKVGNAASQSVSYAVSYGLCLLYDPTKAVSSGAVLPVKFQLCDAGNSDVSSSALVVTALSITQISTSISGTVESVGNANPDNNFRYDSTLGPTGGYIYNLSTKGLSTGTYALTFSVAGAPVPTHQVLFQVK
jgi:hypothetical protein